MKLPLFTCTALAAALGFASAASATELRLSHQWSNTDIRHEVAQILADEVAAADDIRWPAISGAASRNTLWQAG